MVMLMKHGNATSTNKNKKANAVAQSALAKKRACLPSLVMAEGQALKANERSS